MVTAGGVAVLVGVGTEAVDEGRVGTGGSGLATTGAWLSAPARPCAAGELADGCEEPPAVPEPAG